MNHYRNGRAASLIAAMGLAFAFCLSAAEGQSGKRLTLTVLNPDKQAAAEAEVSVWHEGLSESVKLKTNAQGVALVDYPNSTSRLRVTVGGGRDTVPTRLSWGYEDRPATIPESYVLTLEKGAEVKGMVKDDAGAGDLDSQCRDR